MDGYVSSFIEKVNNRLGDQAAVGILELYGEKDLIKPRNIKTFLLVIRSAFEFPNLVDDSASKRPSVTIPFLERLKARIADQELSAKIVETISFVKQKTEAGHETSVDGQKVTRVIRLEEDGKELKTTYKIFLSDFDQEFEAAVTKDGFVIPAELGYSENIGVRVVIGVENLDFSKVHISKFSDEWIIGIDHKPFSRAFTDVVDVRNAERIYYITFQSKEGLDTQLIASGRDPK